MPTKGFLPDEAALRAQQLQQPTPPGKHPQQQRYPSHPAAFAEPGYRNGSPEARPRLARRRLAPREAGSAPTGAHLIIVKNKKMRRPVAFRAAHNSTTIELD
jgi:hypothetical protein